jgi:hypothetical protein
MLIFRIGLRFFPILVTGAEMSARRPSRLLTEIHQPLR